MLPKNEYSDALGVGCGERNVMDGWMDEFLRHCDAQASKGNYAIYV